MFVAQPDGVESPFFPCYILILVPIVGHHIISICFSSQTADSCQYLFEVCKASRRPLPWLGDGVGIP